MIKTIFITVIICIIFSSTAIGGTTTSADYGKIDQCRQLYLKFETTVWENGNPVSRPDKVDHDNIKQYLINKIKNETKVTNVTADFVNFMNNANMSKVPPIERCAVKFVISVLQGNATDYIDVKYNLGRNYYRINNSEKLTVIPSDTMPVFVSSIEQQLVGMSPVSESKYYVIDYTTKLAERLINDIKKNGEGSTLGMRQGEK